MAHAWAVSLGSQARPRAWQWPLAASASACWGLASPPGGLVPLIWLGPLPLLWLMRRGDVSPRRALALGVVGGMCIGLLGFPWMAGLFERFVGIPAWAAWIGCTLFALWMAIPVGLWCLAMRLGPRRGVRGGLFAIVTYIGCMHGWPVLLPYTVTLGMVEMPEWIQAAEFAGTGAVEAQMILFALALLAAFEARGRARVGWAAVALAIPSMSYAWGAWRIDAVRAESAGARRVRFGLVQPNTPLGSRDALRKVEALRTASKALRDQGAQLLVWPEAGVYPYPWSRHEDHDPGGRRSVLAGHGLPIIFGASTYTPGKGDDYNSAFAMEPSGRVVARFDKVFLMPFGERIPVVDPAWARSKIPTLSHNERGAGPVRMTLTPRRAEAPLSNDPVGLGPLICLEDIRADFGREATRVDGGIEVFVNLTIDTWFGDTAEPWEHLALAQYRSVEHRIPMVRAVAAGVTSVVAATGELVAHLDVTDPNLRDWPAPQGLVHDVALPRNTERDPTVFATVGWLVSPLCRWFTLLWALAAIGRGFYSRASKPPPTATSGRSEEQGSAVGA